MGLCRDLSIKAKMTIREHCGLMQRYAFGGDILYFCFAR